MSKHFYIIFILAAWIVHLSMYNIYSGIILAASGLYAVVKLIPRIRKEMKK